MWPFLFFLKKYMCVCCVYGEMVIVTENEHGHTSWKTSRNGYCKRVMTSMAESKRVFKNHLLHKNEDERTI